MTMRPVCPAWLARPVYSFLTNLVFPVVVFLVWPYLMLREKRRLTLFPRLGFQRYPVLDSKRADPVWIHALSVGELFSVVPLIEGLRARLDGRPLVVSVSTLSGHRVAEKRLKGKVDGLFYFPYETAIACRRCLNRVRPALFVLVETDVWPGCLRLLGARGIPGILINARLSDRSFHSFRRWWSLFGPALAYFGKIYPQSEGEAARFRELGVDFDRLGPAGNMKFDAGAGLSDEGDGTALRKILGFRPDDRILIAGSTHPGEELLVLRAFAGLRESLPGLKLLIVPRHPERGREVRDICRASGFEVSLLTDREIGQPDVVVVDRLGFLSRLYSLAEIAVIGGSLVPKGGQNPIEPALAGKPIVFGPDMSDFPDIAPELIEAGGARKVADADELMAACRAWLDDPREALEAGTRARSRVEAHRGTTSRLIDAILRELGTSSDRS